MSMYIEFEPHSWYRGFAIKQETVQPYSGKTIEIWTGYTDNGNTYRIDELYAPTLAELKQSITKYRSK